MSDAPDLQALVGCQVSRISFDHQVTLLLAGHGERQGRVSATLTVESPMTLRVAGSHVRVEPDTGSNYAAVVQLLHRTIASIGMAPPPDRSLRIDFGRDTVLAVHPDPPYEAWSLTGDGVTNWLAGPS